MSVDDIENIIKQKKLQQMIGITESELKLLQNRKKSATDANGLIPANVAADLESAAADRPVQSILSRKDVPLSQLKYNQFLPIRRNYEADYVNLISKGSYVTKYNQRYVFSTF